MNLYEHAERCRDQSGGITARRAHTVHQLATLLVRRLPVTLEALRCEMSALDGYPTTASGADRGGGSSKGSISRPVERAVTQRLGLRDDGEDHGPLNDELDLTEHIATASDTVNRAWRQHFPAWSDRLATSDDIDDWLNVATIALRQAHRICDRHNKPTDPNAPRALRCIGTGDATGATCEQIADYRIGDNGVILHAADGRCVDCRVAVERAEMEASRIKTMERETRRRIGRRK